MVHCGHRDRSRLYLIMCPDELLKAAERATVKFLCGRVGTRQVAIHNPNQPHRLSIFCKLVINPRVIAPKGTHADDGD